MPSTQSLATVAFWTPRSQALQTHSCYFLTTFVLVVASLRNQFGKILRIIKTETPKEDVSYQGENA